MEKHFAVIGSPIAHSLSPLMHQAGFESLGLEAEYQRFDVTSEALENAVKGLKALGFAGWNVTVPYKEIIIPFLDQLTEEANRAGAVNTVKVSEGSLIGHNTDGQGFVRSLKEHLPLKQGMTIALLGAGGAAKGIASALASLGIKQYILNRTEDRAEKLVHSIKEWGGQAERKAWGPGAWLKEVDCIVQTTSVGLKNEPYPFSLEGVNPSTLVIDIIFNPWETPFLIEAKEFGCQTVNGMEMLLYQGVLAWEFWLGVQAPVEAMKSALYHALGQRNEQRA